MTDVFYWGGPVYCNTLKNVQWIRETEIVCKPESGSSNNYSLYGRVGGLLSLANRATEGKVGAIGMGGFSAFHGFARAALKDESVRSRISFLHLADACFMGSGATKPFGTFRWFAKRAVEGKVRMVATTNGPWGGKVEYDHGTTHYSLTSGAKCVQLFWDEVTQGQPIGTAEHPPDVTPPDKAMRCGEFYWFHYERGGHEWHANKLAAPYIQMYAPAWMAAAQLPMDDGELEPVTLPPEPSGPVWVEPAAPDREQPQLLPVMIGAGVIAGCAYLLWRMVR